MSYEIHISVDIWEFGPEGEALGWGNMIMGADDLHFGSEDSDVGDMCASLARSALENARVKALARADDDS